MQNKKNTFSGSFGFLMSAIGAAVGLGNIWSFPYKMAVGGGMGFLIVYFILAILVGVPLLITELSLGRKTGAGPIKAYNSMSKNISFLGKFSVLAAFLVMCYYTVLGGYCVNYFLFNFKNSFESSLIVDGRIIFENLKNQKFLSVILGGIFLVISILIVKKGLSGGIEKFNKIAMPLLFFILIFAVIFSLNLQGSHEGLKFIFNGKGNNDAASFFNVLSSAGEQMFFSLSIAMGAMITYGSYLSKKENIFKNTVIIVIADTLIALLAALAVIPAAFSNYASSNNLFGPELLFVTLQSVFSSLGKPGAIFGALFFLLVLLAAITSAVSLINVAVDSFKIEHKNFALYIIGFLIFSLSVIINIDSMRGIKIISSFTEGIVMPITALCTVIYIAYFIKTDYIVEELNLRGKKQKYFFKAYTMLMKFIVPIILLILLISRLPFKLL